ncbi:MAG: hypothetical protein JXQ29_11745 [Planctomycetes bacterium]|nr:hypothetical protein [Planctomycetota bacterium]
MSQALTREAARAFVERWQLVTEADVAELRATPMGRKLEQLAALAQSAHELGWRTEDAGESAAIRRRWQRLAEHYRG